MTDIICTVPTTAGDYAFPTKDGHPPLAGSVIGNQFVPITRIDRASRLKKLITYPTPSAGRVGPKRHSLVSMASAGEWPTPTVKGNYNKATLSSKAGDGLATAVRWATPTVQDSANNGGAAQFRRNSLPLNAQAAGPLNPTWVELLMGFEPDHTEVIE